jgi:hypothetical protein
LSTSRPRDETIHQTNRHIEDRVQTITRAIEKLVGTKDEGMTTKRLGRGLGVAVMVFAVIGISSVTAYGDASCYTGCSPPTTIQTGGGGGTGPGGSSGTGGRAPVTGSGSGSKTGTGSGSGTSGSSGSSGIKTTAQSGSSGGALPFTGADVEEMTAGGVGALLVGGLLLRRSRNRRRAQA